MRLVDIEELLEDYNAGLILNHEVIEMLEAAPVVDAIVLPAPIGSPAYRIVKRSTGRRSAPRTKNYEQKQPHDIYFVRRIWLNEANAYSVSKDWGKTVFGTMEEAQEVMETLQ